LPTPDRRSVFSINIELDFARGQLADDVEEAARRQRGCALFFYLRFETAANTDVEIGRATRWKESAAWFEC